MFTPLLNTHLKNGTAKHLCGPLAAEAGGGRAHQRPGGVVGGHHMVWQHMAAVKMHLQHQSKQHAGQRFGSSCEALFAVQRASLQLAHTTLQGGRLPSCDIHTSAASACTEVLTCNRAGDARSGTLPLPLTTMGRPVASWRLLLLPTPLAGVSCDCGRCKKVTSKSAPPPPPPPLVWQVPLALCLSAVGPLPQPAALGRCSGDCSRADAGLAAKCAVVHLWLTTFSQANASADECSHAIVCQLPANL